MNKKPWGNHRTLFKGGPSGQPGQTSWNSFKVKHLVILKDHRTSLQFHEMRDELIMVAKGILKLLVRDDNGIEIKILYPGDSFKIKRYVKHRLSAYKGRVEIIEFQFGNRCSEDDIIRQQDDYGRKC